MLSLIHISFKESLSESEILSRCCQGLRDDDADFNEKEAQWVICRLAELLGWERTWKPVSYTHLDVYKRQVYRRAILQPC